MTQPRLPATNNYYQTLFDAAENAILVIDPASGAILNANKRFTTLFGYDIAANNTLYLPDITCIELAELHDYGLDKRQCRAQSKTGVFGSKCA